MSTPLTLRTDRRQDGRRILAAMGEIDMSNVDRFDAALAEAVADAADRAGGGPVVVDLAAVTYLDSGAINAMFTHAEQLELICNPLLVRALIFSGLAEVVDIVEVDPGDGDAGQAGTGDAGTGNAGTGNAGTGEAGRGEAGPPEADT